jgi:NADH-quinone oxidoreductase subunit H
MHEFSLWYTLLNIAIAFGALQGTCAMLIYLERKISAWVQDRHGPNRVGPFGLLQSVADGLKFILKEDVIPDHVDKLLFLLAPCIAMGTAFLAFAVIPFGPVEPVPIPPAPPAPLTARAAPEQQKAYAAAQDQYEQERRAYEEAQARYQGSYQMVIAPNIDIGILFVFAVGSLTVYGIILGGWSANNKYAILGGLRSSAQIISYEIPMGLSILGVVLMTGSLNLERIIWQQAAPSDGGLPMWNVVYQPLAFLLFMIATFAETNRLPFDLPEAEQELVGGYHTEYSAMKFAMFFLGEYTAMITGSFLMTILFFGGWHFPWIAPADGHWTIKLIVIATKMAAFIVFFMLIRWTIPRFRFDQLMALAWKVLIPLALVNLLAVMVILEAQRLTAIAWLPWLLPAISLLVLVVSGYFTAQTPTGTQTRQRVLSVH